MEKLYSSTGIQFESVFIPPSIRPPSATKTLFLIGAGERHLEIHGNMVKITATGVYLEEKAIETLAIKWKGKTDVELMDSDEFYNDIYNGKAVRRRDGYVVELRASRSCDDPIGNIKMLSHMQLNDMEKAARLLLMVRDTQIKMDEKTSFIMRMRNRVVPYHPATLLTPIQKRMKRTLRRILLTIIPIEEIIRMINNLNDEDNDDDVEKDEEDKEEEEHPAPADPSDVSTDDLVPSS
nr:chalcone--flavonone isomerase [Tanacetum cinerariifolium]